MKVYSYLVSFTMGIVIVLVAACSHRQNEQEFSPEVSVMDTIGTTNSILAYEEQESAMTEIINLVMQAPGEHRMDSMDNQIVFNLNGFQYTLCAWKTNPEYSYNKDRLSVYKKPVGTTSQQDLESWSFEGDSLSYWNMKLPGTTTFAFYFKTNPLKYYWIDKNDNRIQLDADQLELAKSVEKDIAKLQGELNEYLRKRFGA